MTIEEYFGDWHKVIDITEADSLIHKIALGKASICPKLKDIFKAFTKCSLHDLRVVIVGQDPYPTVKHGIPIATGIAFANSKDTSKDNYSPSLEVLRESIMNYCNSEDCSTFDPSLEKWEEQGVLMLNTALSCLQGQPGSQSLMWRPFIRNLFINLSQHSPGVVYVLMGRDAQSFEPYINHRFNHIIKTEHPAVYARHSRMLPPSTWRTVDAILIGQNGYGINWI